MGKTALQLVTSACYGANIPAPSALVGATSTDVLQLTELFYDTGRELRNCRVWPQLKRWHFIILESGRSQYPLPLDFYSALPGTQYETANQWALCGPETDPDWAFATYGIVDVTSRKRFRVFGPDVNPNDSRGQFYVSPTPDDGDAGELVTFEYVSKSWLIPPLWTAGESLAQNTYRFANGNIYKKTDSGSDATSTTAAPNMANGLGQDGSVFWLYISPTAFAPGPVIAGNYFTSIGNLYKCTGSGVAANPAPSGTDPDTDITAGTATFRYMATNSAPDAWIGATEYEIGDHIFASAQWYRAVQGPHRSATLRSGTVEPAWTATTVPDGAATQTYQTSPYEALVTDSDLCLFDDELMIEGLKWRFLRARGLQYQDVRADYERMKGRAVARFNPGRILSLAGRERPRYPNIPEGNWGQ